MAYSSTKKIICIAQVQQSAAKLGLQRGASYKDCKRAYFKLAKQCHPDTGKSGGDFREINEAY